MARVGEKWKKWLLSLRQQRADQVLMQQQLFGQQQRGLH